MRWARVEVLRRDLEDTWVATVAGGRPGTGEWRDLCGLWSGEGEGGLWGLRLGIKGRVGAQVVLGEAVGGSGVVSVAFMKPVSLGDNVDEIPGQAKGFVGRRCGLGD